MFALIAKSPSDRAITPESPFYPAVPSYIDVIEVPPPSKSGIIISVTSFEGSE